jgi:hypothetical protein
MAQVDSAAGGLSPRGDVRFGECGIPEFWPDELGDRGAARRPKRMHAGGRIEH